MKDKEMIGGLIIVCGIVAVLLAIVWLIRSRVAEQYPVHIENGTVGLDWILLAPVNIRDEQRVFEFLKMRHAKPRKLTENGVTYLRAEEGDLVQVCQHIMSGLYGIKESEVVDLLAEGFSWKP